MVDYKLLVGQNELERYEVENHEPSYLPKGKKWKLVWCDEFDGDKLDETKWMYRINFWGKPFPAFCDKGVSLDGKSNAVFRPVRMSDGRICSTQLQTGSNSFDVPKDNFTGEINMQSDNNFWQMGSLPKPTFMHRFGYYEVRCKLQKTNGWWSAFWLQTPSPGMSYNPEWSGVEVDIMESFGPRPDPGQLTCGNFYGGYGRDLKTDARTHYRVENVDEYHRFGLLWTEKEYVFYCDGIEVARTSKVVSQVEEFILLTTEIQGYRRGDGKMHEPKAELSIDDEFIVDYVRVFDEIK